MDKMIICLRDIVSGPEYKIPLYQRNFSWTSEQITTLLRDIYDCIKSGKDKYYIGSLVVKPISNGIYEVIDGQQRLTVISLITSLLNYSCHLKLSYVSRQEVDSFFKMLYEQGVDKIIAFDAKNQLKNYRDAVLTIRGCVSDDESDDTPIINKMYNGVSFKDYFFNNVYLVQEVMPKETDVAKYFEIMNNRGKQLQHHEILKALMMSTFKDDISAQKDFAEVWDNCSQMDRRIQKIFKGERRKSLFGYKPGSEYSELYLDNVFISTTVHSAEKCSLKNILSENYQLDDTNYDSDVSDAKDDKENSIIDFPNFLMHVFKVYYSENYGGEGIPLNEKYLIDVYNELRNKGCFQKPEQVKEFCYNLLKSRVLFDRYIVKVTENGNDEDDVRWTLRKPIEEVYDGGNKKRLYFTPTFSESDPNYEQIKMALEMLQVSFRTRTYKNYLFQLLSWLNENCPSSPSLEIQPTDYLKRIHTFILSYFEDKQFSDIAKQPLGEGMHHMLLNFIDYLYWCSSRKGQFFEDPLLDNEIKLVNKQFDFKYWNSVEHHYPRQRQIDFYNEEHVEKDEVNCIGNLFLISKSSNSSLGKMQPTDKAKSYIDDIKQFPSSRSIVYKMSLNGSWGKEQINSHKECIFMLLSYRNEILEMN